MWLLRGAVLELVARGRASDETGRAVLGHIVYRLLLERTFLSVLCQTFKLVVDHLGVIRLGSPG